MICKKLKTKVKLLLLICGFVVQPVSADEKAFWIDVRTAEEFLSGHVADSTNIPYIKLENVHLLPPDKTARLMFILEAEEGLTLLKHS